MPILHIQFIGQGEAPDGTLFEIPPTEVMAQRGPVLQVTIGLLEDMAQQLAQQGLIIPPPIAGLALIDTGASATCIDDAVAQQLGLPVIDVTQIASATHAATQQNVYPALIEAAGFPIKFNAPRAIGAPLASQGIIALIGRDLLRFGTLFYNGLTGEITFAL